MKRKVLTSILCSIALCGMCQFVAQPLNYPGTGYWPYYYSIVDPDHIWIGTFHENGLPFPYAIKTTDGGNSWIFDSIPLPNPQGCVSICGWDTNTCFFVFAGDMGIINPSIWKTNDGGTSWSNIITTQFIGSFINFYHAFSSDTGLAVGDPTDGYFEIQLTFDGGNTWSRVPSSNIPAMLSDEIGLNHSYSAVGNSIWFTTSKARCFRSSDRGQTWGVTTIVPGASLDLGVCFSTEQKGALWNRGAIVNQLVVSNNGGVTWDSVSFPSSCYLLDMSRVPGWEGAFVVTAFNSVTRVYFTPDLFNTLQVLQSNIMSNGAVEFFDAATGWLGGGESGINEIYKYVYVLDAGGTNSEPWKKLSILPNPSSGQILVTIPEGLDSKELEIRVTDMTSKVLTQYPVDEKNYYQIDLERFDNGVYLVVLYKGNAVLATQRFIINH